MKLVIDKDMQSQHITNIKGIESNSASPTDTWMIYMSASDSDYNLFTKIYLTPNETLKSMYNRSSIVKKSGLILDALRALDYEAKVYKQIRDNILNTHVSTSFVRLVNFTEDIEYKNIMKILTNRVINSEDKSIMSHEQISECFRRNTLYMFAFLRKRPSINTPVSPEDKQLLKGIPDTIMPSLRYNTIITEPINGMKFSQYLNDYVFTSKRITNDTNKILFQIAIACYSLFLNGINHNDMHCGNVFVIELPSITTMVYKVDDEVYYINTKYAIKLYDFDRAYSVILGKNEQLDGQLCNSLSQCNILIENKDFIKIMCYVYRLVLSNEKRQILTILSNTADGRKYLKTAYENFKGCFLQSGNNISMPESYYKEFKTIPEILKLLYDNTDTASIDMSQIQPENVFVVDKTCFKNYRALPKKIYKAREDLYNKIMSKSRKEKNKVKTVLRIPIEKSNNSSEPIEMLVKV